jgi:hypothetical protein
LLLDGEKKDGTQQIKAPFRTVFDCKVELERQRDRERQRETERDRERQGNKKEIISDIKKYRTITTSNLYYIMITQYHA